LAQAKPKPVIPDLGASAKHERSVSEIHAGTVKNQKRLIGTRADKNGPSRRQ